jgi:hypothetical protein
MESNRVQMAGYRCQSMNFSLRMSVVHSEVRACPSIDGAAQYRSHSSWLIPHQCYSGSWQPFAGSIYQERLRTNEIPLGREYYEVPTGVSCAARWHRQAHEALTEILRSGYAIPSDAWPIDWPIPEWCYLARLSEEEMMSGLWICPDHSKA